MIGLAVASALYIVIVSLGSETASISICPVTKLSLWYDYKTGVLHVESRLAWTEGTATELVVVYVYNCTCGNYTVFRVYTPMDLTVSPRLNQVLIVALSTSSANWTEINCSLKQPVYFSLCGVYSRYEYAKRCLPVLNCSGSPPDCVFVGVPELSTSCPAWNASANVFLWLGRLVRVAVTR